MNIEPLLIDDVKKLDKPETRIIFWILIIAVIALSGVIVIFFTSDKGNTKELKAKVEFLEKKVDSLNSKLEYRESLFQQRLSDANKKYDDVQALRYAESQSRINELNKILNTAQAVNAKVNDLK